MPISVADLDGDIAAQYSLVETENAVAVGARNEAIQARNNAQSAAAVQGVDYFVEKESDLSGLSPSTDDTALVGTDSQNRTQAIYKYDGTSWNYTGNSLIASGQIGSANGIAGLDGSGRVPDPQANQNASNLASGTVPDAQVNPDASNLTTGTVPDAQLPAEVPLTDESNTWTAAQTYEPGTQEWLRHSPDGIDPDAENFYYNVAAVSNPNIARDNVVWIWGYNVHAGGGSRDLTDAQVSYRIETHYEGSPNEAWIEAHLEFWDTNQNQARLFSWTVNKNDPSKHGYCNLRGQSFFFNTIANDIQLMKIDGNKIISFGLPFFQRTHNVSALRQRDSQGNQKTIAKINADDLIESDLPYDTLTSKKVDQNTAASEVFQMTHEETSVPNTFSWRFMIRGDNGELSLDSLQQGRPITIEDVSGIQDRIYINSNGLGIGDNTPKTGIDQNGGEQASLGMPLKGNLVNGGMDAKQYAIGFNETDNRIAFTGRDSNSNSLSGDIPFFQGSNYSPSNETTVRTFDANNTTVAELADVLATLLNDLNLT